MMSLTQEVLLKAQNSIPIEQKRAKYSQDEIDFFKPSFPDWSEDDIVEMLFSADLYASMQEVEAKYQL